MSADDARVIDVRPILQAGGEPLDAILAAAGSVPEGGSLVVVAPFEPVPLYGVLRQMGFVPEAAEQEGGGHRVVFRRADRLSGRPPIR